ncbi:hypothetical protein [Pseudonocardia spirodelae]|uniref:Uncharacterized protein n=1 Tax=Pseudonocardia spirodelae TaxID=3133431 RepID=A0ABU8TCJ2_9PSEU
MNPLARTALRVSLAGAGVAALGAGVVGHASAAELPEPLDAADTSALTDALPSAGGEGTSSFGDLQSPQMQLAGLPELPAGDAVSPDALSSDALSTDALPTDALPTDALPTDALPTDALPTDALTDRSVGDQLPTLEIPDVMYLEAPTVSF